jgi:hypothetical protein
MKQYLIEVLVSKKSHSYYKSATVLVDARSLASAKLQARKSAEKTHRGWRAKPLSREDGSVYTHIKFTRA